MTSENDVWIVGAGGVGSVLAARLEQARPGSVLLIDTWAEHVDTINSSGLTVDYPDGTVHVKPRAVLLSDLRERRDPPALVVLAVKAYDTATTVEAILPHIGLAPVLSLQNSINEEVIADIIGANRTIGGVCLYSAGLVGPGHGVQGMANGKIVIGELDRTVGPRIENLARILRVSIGTDISADIWSELWTKLIRNAMVNGMAAITNLGMGELVLVPGADRICIGLGSEAVRVAFESGFHKIVTGDLFDCSYEYPADWYLLPVNSDERNKIELSFHDSWVPHPTVYPSMLQDLRKGRRTEIEGLNGYVVSKGREVGVPTPLNSALCELILRASETSQFANPDDVMGELLPLVQ